MAVGSSLISQVKSWVLPPTIVELLELCLAALGSTVEHASTGGHAGGVGSCLAHAIGSITALLCSPQSHSSSSSSSAARQQGLAKEAGLKRKLC
jgi:hypothetical protein